ncbi:MAG: FAD-binding oxidoreductase [Patescibacteria group bacterium]
MNIKEEFERRIRGTVSDETTDLQTHANDASIFEIVPLLVVTPEDTHDLKTVVNFVRELKEGGQDISITARAAGTGMSGESLTSSIALDMKKFNRIIEVGEDFSIVEPTVYYRDFEIEAAKKGLLLPSYTASKKLCTVGGMVANNSAGEKTLSFGSTNKYVRELKVVLSDGNEYVFKPLVRAELNEKLLIEGFEGNLYRRMYEILENNYDLIKSARPNVSKNTAGYNLWDVWDRETFDLTQLFTGSEGTLGIMTEISFKLIKPKPFTELLVIFIKDLAELGDVVNKILPHKPESFESYDDRTLELAEQFLPDIARSLGEAIRSKIVLLAEFTGDSEEEVVLKARRAQSDIQGFGTASTTITRDRQDADKYWTIRRESFNLLRHHSGHDRTAPIIEDIIVRPEYLPEFLPRLYAILDSYNLKYTIAGHIGDGNLHIMPLMNFHKDSVRDIAIELCEKVFSLVFEYHGSMSAEHNDGLIRTPFLKQMYGTGLVKLFEETKLIFDPLNIFNPGKKVFGKDIAFLKEHIDRVY